MPVNIDRNSPDEAQAVIERCLPDIRIRKLFLSFLADSIRAAHAANPGTWSLSLFRKELRLNVGRVEAIALFPNEVHIILYGDKSLRNDLGKIKNVKINPPQKRTLYRTVPLSFACDIPSNMFVDLSQNKSLLEAHYELIKRGAIKGGNASKRAHSPGVLKYLENHLSIGIPNPTVTNPNKYWIYAPGEKAQLWNEFYDKKIMGIGWDYLGDLRLFKSRTDITRQLKKEEDKENVNPSNSSLAVWQFLKDVNPGDIVIAKKGRTDYVGYGVVVGDYKYDETRTAYKHIRSIDWKKRGSWKSLGIGITKTLTDITKNHKDVDKLQVLFGINNQIPIEPLSEFRSAYDSSFVSSLEVAPQKKTPEDFEQDAKNRRETGERAEKIVLDAERSRLEDAGQVNLADKVSLVSDQIGLGYDILSYETNGAKRYIEVKAITDAEISFIVTPNELKKSRELPNFYFYLVSNPYSTFTKIKPIEGYKLTDDCIKPSEYRARIEFLPNGVKVK